MTYLDSAQQADPPIAAHPPSPDEADVHLAQETEAEQPTGDDRASLAWQVAMVVSFALLIALASFAAGILAEREIFSDQAAGDGGPTLGEIGALLEAEAFYWPDDPATREGLLAAIEEAALSRAVETFGDPYTAYLPPDDALQAEQQLQGEYGGIGVYIEVVDGALTVVAPMPGSPAEEVGLRTDDVLLFADGHPLSGLTPEEAGAFVTGPEGSVVRLTVQRPGTAEPFDVEIVRRKIEVPVVVYGFDEAARIAIVKVTAFNDKTTDQLDAALEQADADGASGIVLDLRGNGGGYVSAAQEMVGRFVPEDRGPTLFEDEDRAEDNELQELPILDGGPEVFELPLVVLVDGGTASAAEIVAGALRDHDRAVVAGETTFGKGSVQRVHDFADGSSLRVTFAVWLTPEKLPIDGVGIAPAVPIPTDEDRPVGPDPDLGEAIAGDDQLRAAIALAAGGDPATVVATPAATPIIG